MATLTLHLTFYRLHKVKNNFSSYHKGQKGIRKSAIEGNINLIYNFKEEKCDRMYMILSSPL